MCFSDSFTMRATTIILGLLMVFSSTSHKVAGAPNLDTFADDQDFGGSGDYSDYRGVDHRGEHTPSTIPPSSRSGSDTLPPSSSSSGGDPHSHDSSSRGGGGGLLDATNVATYDDEDYADGGDYGSGDYDAAYDGEDMEGETYDEDYDTSVQGGHAGDHTTTTTTTTTTAAPTTSTTTLPPPPPPPPVVEVTTTTTTTTPPPSTTTTITTTTTAAPSTTTTTTLLPSTTSPPSSIIEENGIYSTDEEGERNKKRKKNKNNRGGAADKDKDYGYEDEEYEDEDEYYDEEDAGDNYDDEDYGVEGSGVGVLGVGTSEDTAAHHPEVEAEEDLHIHHHEDHGVTAGEDHFTFDKAPIEEEAEEEDYVPIRPAPPRKEEPAPPRTTDNEIWLTPEHPDSHVPEGEKKEDDDAVIYDDSDPFGRRRPVDKAEDDLSLGAGDGKYGRSGSDTNMDGSVQIVTHKEDERQVSIFAQPGILAAFIGGAVVGLLCAILLVMFVVYRMRKKDEGSYPLDEPKRLPLTSSYATTDKEIYA